MLVIIQAPAKIVGLGADDSDREVWPCCLAKGDRKAESELLGLAVTQRPEDVGHGIPVGMTHALRRPDRVSQILLLGKLVRVLAVQSAAERCLSFRSVWLGETCYNCVQKEASMIPFAVTHSLPFETSNRRGWD